MVSFTVLEYPPVPFTVAEMRTHLYVTDATLDDDILAMMQAASAACSRYCGVGFGVGRYLVTEDRFPGQRRDTFALWDFDRDAGCECKDHAIRLPITPVVSGSVVLKYRDGAGTLVTLNSTKYHVGTRSGQILPSIAAGAWPMSGPLPEAVEIEFSAGGGLIPPQAIHAIKLTVGQWWMDRGDAMTKHDIPQSAKFLLDQLRSGEFR
jgi:hypothetical protein